MDTKSISKYRCKGLVRVAIIIIMAVFMVINAYESNRGWLSTNHNDGAIGAIQFGQSVGQCDIESWNQVQYNMAVNPDYRIGGSYGFYEIENYFDYGVYVGDSWLYQSGGMIKSFAEAQTDISGLEDKYAVTILYKFDRNQNFMNAVVGGTYFSPEECRQIESVLPTGSGLYTEVRTDEEVISNLAQSVEIFYGISDGALVEYPYSDCYTSAAVERNLYNTYYTDMIWIAYWFVVAAALLLPLMWKRKEGYTTYESWKICKLPLEVVALIYMIGHYILLTKNLDDLVMGYVPVSVQIVLFSLFYLLVFWTITNVREIFIMKMEYFKERCLVVRFWGNIKIFGKEQYRQLIEFDFQDKTNRLIFRIVIVNFFIVAVLTVLWGIGTFIALIYSIVIFLFLKKYYIRVQDDFQEVLDETMQIAAGYLDINLEKPVGSFAPIQEELRGIQAGFKKAVEEEVKSVNMKTELISNVSHDLKTPLTAIITYVDLLKDEKDEEKREKYIEVLEMKSSRLKRLIEDLFEVSKASSKNVTMNYANIDVVEILKQVCYEYEENFVKNKLEIRWDIPEEKQILSLDGEKTYRIFENLLLNITKYALPHTRVYIEVQAQEECTKIIFRNISAEELNFSVENLTNRFVRGDTSRNTEGSGLGLAIAKSFVELQGGALQLSVEADLFKVEVELPRKR